MSHRRPLYTVIPTMTLAGVTVVLIGTGVFAYPVTAATPTGTGVQAPVANTANYLPDISLTNQYGKTISLASLKGKPLLVSFIHTSCKGVCELMTAKMKTVSTDLGTNGTNVTMVSISTDPDDDGPRQLLAYAKKEGILNDGFVLLTGRPAKIKQVLALYQVNQHEGDNEMTHVFDLFLIGPDGKQVRHYKGLNIQAAKVASDIRQTLAGQ